MESHSLWSENWLAGSRFQRKVPRGGVGDPWNSPLRFSGWTDVEHRFMGRPITVAQLRAWEEDRLLWNHSH